MHRSLIHLCGALLNPTSTCPTSCLDAHDITSQVILTQVVLAFMFNERSSTIRVVKINTIRPIISIAFLYMAIENGQDNTCMYTCIQYDVKEIPYSTSD